MNDGIFLDRYIVVEDFLPDNVPVVGGIGADNVEQLPNVHGLQLGVVASDVEILHELSHSRIAFPVERAIKSISVFLFMRGTTCAGTIARYHILALF